MKSAGGVFITHDGGQNWNKLIDQGGGDYSIRFSAVAFPALVAQILFMQTQKL
jgi:photosystem II stability/assembly factor-like uncharacterized protein